LIKYYHSKKTFKYYACDYNNTQLLNYAHKTNTPW